MLGLIGAALHPQPRTAFVVGLGTGETAGWLAEVPSIRARRRRRAGAGGPGNGPPLPRGQSRRPGEPQGATDLQRRAGSAADDRRALRPDRLRAFQPVPQWNRQSFHPRILSCRPRSPATSGGMFVQWVQAYEIDRRTMRTVFATFKSVFPHVEVWQSKLGDLVLVGSQQKTGVLGSRAAEQGGGRALRLRSALRLAHHRSGGAVVPLCRRRGAGRSFHRRGRCGDQTPMTITKSSTASPGRWDAPTGMPPGSCAANRSRSATRGCRPGRRRRRLAERWRWTRQWDAAVRGGKKLSAEDLALNEGICDKVLERYVAKDARGMFVAWEFLPHSPPCLTELAVDRPPLC